MRWIRILLSSAAICFSCFSMTEGADRFERIKADLSTATCTRFEFLSIIESDVFDQTDSVYGMAYVAHDGRFNVVVGDDRYLFTGADLYSYSAENNQVVIERAADTEAVSREISFITRLDEYYKTQVRKPDNHYHLVKRDSVSGNVPDSVDVFLSRQELRLDRLEYFDVNDERNLILLLKQESDTTCRTDEFEPSFPDSVEKVRL
jgi:hypothetical protein